MSFDSLRIRGFFVYFDKRTIIRQFTLHKIERVKKRKAVERLFNEGKSFSIFPIRVYYLLDKCAEAAGKRVEIESPLQFGVGVSKRHFKKAVDRNRVKRLIREAYRIQKLTLKQILVDKEGYNMQVFFIYTGKELPLFTSIKEKMREALVRLQKETEKKQ